jgi:hypothetical protein
LPIVADTWPAQPLSIIVFTPLPGEPLFTGLEVKAGLSWSTNG